MNTVLIGLLIYGNMMNQQPANMMNGSAEFKTAIALSMDYKDKRFDYINQLKALGYYKREYKDEKLNSRNAVLWFQSSCNQVADGIMGDRFKCALISRLMVNGSYDYPDKIIKPASMSYWITINRNRRILTLYENNKVVKKYPITIGKTDSRTPQGQFKVILKGINPKWSGGNTGKKPVKGGSPANPLGVRWIGLSVGGGDIYGIHGNNKPFSIGKQVSNGCIRMINSDVAELYDIVGINTPVWVGTDSNLKKWGVQQSAYY